MMQGFGIGMFLFGIIIIFIIRQRKFSRRATITDQEQSKLNERDALITKGEKLARSIAIILVLIGIFFFVVGWGDQKLAERNREAIPGNKDSVVIKS